jgi:hypothetical protein
MGLEPSNRVCLRLGNTFHAGLRQRLERRNEAVADYLVVFDEECMKDHATKLSRKCTRFVGDGASLQWESISSDRSAIDRAKSLRRWQFSSLVPALSL